MNDDLTIVTACDEGYAFGVWLLISSIRKHGMKEKVLEEDAAQCLVLPYEGVGERHFPHSRFFSTSNDIGAVDRENTIAIYSYAPISLCF